MDIKLKYANEERIKYERMWELDSYRERSPGERFFSRALQELDPMGGDTLCDWGIGTGRAAQKFLNYNIDVEGVDIAKNASREFNGLVHIGPIWDPPFHKNKKFMYGYCTDVMEHIPTDMVVPSFQAIKRHTSKACWFTIANFVDHEGDKIGEVLHLTVKPPVWWANAIALVFPRFEFSAEAKHVVVKAYSEGFK